jgi:DNA-binding Xre family transcriptional regulator
MPIIVNRNLMLARRKTRAKQLAERAGFAFGK